MSDITISSSLVQPGESVPTSLAISGADFSAPGMLLYIDGSDRGRAKKADALTFAKSQVAGVNLNAATTGQPLIYQTDGTYGVGGALTVGTVYVASTNAGGIAPITDMTTGSYVSVWGVALTTAQIDIARFNSGVAKT
jgi:hypothetical protein